MRTFQTAGLAFLFVPISTIAYMTLPRELNGDGAALFAMFRNIFGSIGIALATSQVTQRSQVHQSYLSQWLTPLNQPYQALVAQYEQALRAMGRVGAAAHDQAVGRVYQVFRTQAAILGYRDVFFDCAIVAFLIVPCASCYRQRPAACGPEGAIDAEALPLPQWRFRRDARACLAAARSDPTSSNRMLICPKTRPSTVKRSRTRICRRRPIRTGGTSLATRF